MKYLRPLSVSLFVFLFSIVQATDLRPTLITPPYSFELNHYTFITLPINASAKPIEVIILNDSIYAAETFDVTILVIDSYDNDTLFKDTKTGTNLQPHETTTIISDPWLPVMGFTYDIYVTVSYQYDVVPSNDTRRLAEVSSLFTSSVIDDKVSEWREKYLKDRYGIEEQPKLPAYVNPTILTPEQKIITADDPPVEYTLEDFRYMAYLPFDFSDKFEQPGYLLLINALDTADVVADSINYYVSVDSVPYLPDVWSKIDSEDQVAGPEPGVDSIVEFNTVHEEIITPERDSACALIVSGRIREDWERSSFTKDLDFVEGNLMREQYGPQLSQDQIIRIGNATKTEILDALNQMKDKCDKIYFYYTGHGWEGGMTTNDDGVNQLFYLDLAAALFATNADELFVIIDACYSGSAEGRFRLTSGFEDQNLTLITSSMSTKTSLSSTVLTTSNGERYNPGFFTWNFMKCFGDPRADADGDGKTSLAESYHWLLQENPKTSNGESIARVQNPQLIVNRAVKPQPAQTRIHVPEVNIDLEFDEPLDEGASLHIEEHNEVIDTIIASDSVYYMSTERYYNINLKNQFTTFRVDVQFTYDYNIDDLDSTGIGEIGLVKRSTIGDPWVKIETENFPDSNKVVAKGQTGFSDFAFARVIPSGTVVVSIPDFKSNQDAMMVSIYPNPAKSNFTVSYNLQQSGIVRLQLIDLTGKVVYKKSFNGIQGKNTVQIDNYFRGIKPGNYMLKIYGERNIALKKVVIE